MENRDVLIFLHSLYLSDNLMKKLLEFEELDEILHMSKEDLLEVTGAKEIQIEKLVQNRNKEYFNKLISDINKHATQVFTIFDEDYPEELKYIEDPPLVIYAKGLKLNLDGVKIGVVGSRKATAYGKYATEKFVEGLAEMGVTIVSGMAQGIDALSIHLRPIHRLPGDAILGGRRKTLIGCLIHQSFVRKALSRLPVAY